MFLYIIIFQSKATYIKHKYMIKKEIKRARTINFFEFIENITYFFEST